MRQTIVIITIAITGVLFAQNIEVTGAGSSVVNGIYLTSDPTTQGGAFYYTKAGTPTLYLYRRQVGVNCRWIISSNLGVNFNHASVYYYTGISKSNCNSSQPDGLTFTNIGSSGTSPEPTAGDTPLAVELSHFSAKAIPTGVKIEWSTESEIENQGFIIDRRTDNSGWLEIASFLDNDKLKGQGTVTYKTNYIFSDTMYTRIKNMNIVLLMLTIMEQ